jgi:hypothetical protein
MHFIHLQKQSFIFFVFITKTISIPTNNLLITKQCNWQETNCTSNQYPTLSTTTQYPSTTETYAEKNSYGMLTIFALVVAGIVFSAVIARICLILCNSSRYSNNSLSNRRTSAVRPQIAIIRQVHFKPDVPPTYAEATANIDSDESKLPSYDDLHNEQHARSANTT